MQYDNFDCEVADGCATVRLVGPGAPDLGAMCDEFVDLMLRLQEDRAARVILLTDGDHAFDLHRDLEGLAGSRGRGRGFELLAAEDEIARRTQHVATPEQRKLAALPGRDTERLQHVLQGV